MTKDIQHSFSQDKMHIVMRNTDCPNCEYHRQRAQNWREEAYKQAGHPLPEREWVGLTNEEVFAVSNTMPYGDRFDFAVAIEAKLKEKNDRTL
jgi:hypothetical protein